MEMQTDPSKLIPLTVGNKVFRSAYDYELSDSDLEMARIELNETESVRNACLQDLKERLSTFIGDGIIYRTDDAHLLRFLRCKRFRCKEACEMIQNFYSVRKKYPHVFCSLPSHLETLLNANIVHFLPYRDEEGSLIILHRLGRWKTSEYTIYDGMEIIQIITDIISLNPAGQINKIIFFMDFKGTDMRHFSMGLNPKHLRFWLTIFQSLNPWRVKRVILSNCHKLTMMAVNTIRFMLKKKIAERIVVIGSDMGELHKYVNPVLLPKEFGGSLEESECKITDHIMKNLPYIKYEHSFYTCA